MSEYTEPFQKDIDEYIEHERDGFERIKKYYDDHDRDYNIRGEFPNLDTPPHGLIAQRAANIVKFGLGQRKEPTSSGSPESTLSAVSTGIATEILLKAIVLKEDPKWFIQKTEEKENKPPETPRYESCKKKIMSTLPENYSQKQKKRLSQILELIQIQRNNEVHLSFHTTGIYREPHQKLQMFLFFFQQYFNSEDFNILEYEDFIAQLNEAVEDSRIPPNGSIDYPKVDLLDY